MVCGAVVLLLLGFEVLRVRRIGKRTSGVLLTGVVAIGLLLLAVLRPVFVESAGVSTSARMYVLLDDSRSMRLPAEGDSLRLERAKDVATRLPDATSGARLEFVRFGEGAVVADPDRGATMTARAPASDLTAALESIAASNEEPPGGIIVVSDGALDRPTKDGASQRAALGLGAIDVPIHTVRIADEPLRDASVGSVQVAGTAIAHQPFGVRVEILCSGGIACGKVPVVVRELPDSGAPIELARGEAVVPDDGSSTVELSVTLHRAGARVIEVAIEAPSGDVLPENNTRFATLDVARDRIRILHIAGRPTYDVRALRNWLKSDASIDVVAFFILRTPTDQVGASGQELALIPFPVDELFTIHLDSFDAVVLQDFHAATYGLEKHLTNLADYVRKGGGLILVGGPDSFGPGKYAATQLAPVLPVKLTKEHEKNGVDLSLFTPLVTSSGRIAPVLGPLRRVVGDSLPDMPGTNIVGEATKGATVLWSHPTLGGESRMPVLSLGEFGTGRVIALTVDGTHKLLFSTFAVAEAGRAYGALWEGLLGWLMRDPRFESTSLHFGAGCFEGEPTTVSIQALPEHAGDAELTIVRLGTGESAFETKVALPTDGSISKVELPALSRGGYSARVRIVPRGSTADEDSAQPATRRDFACEKGGDEWADSRPDPDRLRAISKASGGTSVAFDALTELPKLEQTFVASRRAEVPVAPAWMWTTLAAVAVGLHWILRRRSGFS